MAAWATVTRKVPSQANELIRFCRAHLRPVWFRYTCCQIPPSMWLIRMDRQVALDDSWLTVAEIPAAWNQDSRNRTLLRLSFLACQVSLRGINLSNPRKHKWELNLPPPKPWWKASDLHHRHFSIHQHSTTAVYFIIFTLLVNTLYHHRTNTNLLSPWLVRN